MVGKARLRALPLVESSRFVDGNNFSGLSQSSSRSKTSRFLFVVSRNNAHRNSVAVNKRESNKLGNDVHNGNNGNIPRKNGRITAFHAEAPPSFHSDFHSNSHSHSNPFVPANMDRITYETAKDEANPMGSKSANAFPALLDDDDDEDDPCSSSLSSASSSMVANDRVFGFPSWLSSSSSSSLILPSLSNESRPLKISEFKASNAFPGPPAIEAGPSSR